VSGLRLAVWVLRASVATGCGVFIQLGSIAVTSFPSTRNQIIAAADTAWVELSSAVSHQEAEALFAVTSTSGVVDGDLTWNGRRLIFRPVQPWHRGVRHLLAFGGSLTDDAGKTLYDTVELPFFVDFEGVGAALQSWSPATGDSVVSDTALVLTFSAAIDTTTLADALRFSPTAVYETAWNAAETVATVTAVSGWSDLTVYAWTLATTLRTSAGQPLALEQSGSFRVQADIDAPTVVSVEPALASWPLAFPAAGASLADLQFADAIRITFSEDVELSSVTQALQLTPTVAGSVHRIDSGVFVFIPETGYQMSTSYDFVVATSVTDLAGLAMRSPYQEQFTPAITPIQVSQIATADFTVNAFPDPTIHDANIGAGDEYFLQIDFTQPIQADAILRALIVPLGPGLAAVPTITQITFASPASVALRFEPFTRSLLPTSEVLYQLTLPGAVSEQAIGNGVGAYLDADVVLTLRAR
jgi:hypothetical protein